MKKKKLIIIIISLILLVALIFIIYKAIHKKDDNISKIVVKNGLSINYLDGNDIVSGKKEKEYRFSITNDTVYDKYYQITIADLIEIDNLSYNIYCEETKVEKTGTSIKNSALVDYAVITPGETHNYVLTISPSINTIKIGTLDIDEHTFVKEYFSQTIIANSTIYQKPKTSVGTDISQGEEGLVQDIDDDGVTYYFRGSASNNYFKFADMMWRIVRINGNNTVKVVLDQTTGDLINYYNEGTEDFYKYGNSNIKTYLQNWYNENLKTSEKYIYSGKLCDYTLHTGSEEYIFEASQRLGINQNPTFNCLGNKINSKIMLLTADEIEYAGGLIGLANNNYYLYNPNVSQQSWTITPAKGNATYYNPYVLSNDGSIVDSIDGKQTLGVRPVINISKNVTVTGNGTIDNPYVITN